MSRIEKYDDRDNLIYFEYDNGYKVWREFDKNDNCIHWRDSGGEEHWWKHRIETSTVCTEITKEEFEEIRSKRSEDKEVLRFELLDLKED